MHTFTRVIFSLISSPFLLNGTLKVQFSELLHQQIYGNFTLEKLLRNLYVDNLASSFNDEKNAFQFYEKSKNFFFLMGGFELWKCNKNCERLRDFTNDTKEAIREYCIFYFTDIVNQASNLPFTKRNVLELPSMFLDPLRWKSTILLQIKRLFN